MAEQPSGERESAEVNPELPNRESFNFLGKKTFYFSRGVQAGKLCECRAPTEHMKKSPSLSCLLWEDKPSAVASIAAKTTGHSTYSERVSSTCSRQVEAMVSTLLVILSFSCFVVCFLMAFQQKKVVMMQPFETILYLCNVN